MLHYELQKDVFIFFSIPSIVSRFDRLKNLLNSDFNKKQLYNNNRIMFFVGKIPEICTMTKTLENLGITFSGYYFSNEPDGSQTCTFYKTVVEPFVPLDWIGWQDDCWKGQTIELFGVFDHTRQRSAFEKLPSMLLRSTPSIVREYVDKMVEAYDPERSFLTVEITRGDYYCS